MMNKKSTKRLISLLIAIIMCIFICPTLSSQAMTLSKELEETVMLLDAPKLGGVSPSDIGASFAANVITESNLALTNPPSLNVCFKSLDGADNQIWLFTRNSDMSYSVINAYDNMSLDVASGAIENNSNVMAWAYNGGANQRFYIYYINNAYFIMPSHTARVLDSDIDHNNAQIYDFDANNPRQRMSITKLDLSGSVPYNVGNTLTFKIMQTTNKYLDENVMFSDSAGENEKLWMFTRVTSGAYKIVNVKTGMALTLKSDAFALENYSGNDSSQHFYLHYINGSYIIRSSKSTNVLERDANNTAKPYAYSSSRTSNKMTLVRSLSLKSGSTLSIATGILIRVPEGMSVEEIKKNIDGIYDFEFYNGQTLLKSSDSVVTNTKVKVGITSFEPLSVAVTGDLSGDGRVTSSDYLMVKRSVAGKYTLSATQTAAANCDKVSGITANDYLAIKLHFKEGTKLMEYSSNNLDSTATTFDEPLVTSSPNNDTAMLFWLEDGKPYYSVSYKNKSAIKASPLGIITSNADMTSGLKIISTSEKSKSDSFKLIEGYSYNEDCIERVIVCRNGANDIIITFNVFNGGVAFKYTLTGTGNVTITNEKSAVLLSSERGTLKYMTYPQNKTYEGEYQTLSSLQMFDNNGNYTTPTLVASESNDFFVLLAEAGSISNESLYCSSTLESKANSALLSFTFGFEETYPNQSEDKSDSHKITSFSSKYPVSTPWRTAIFGTTLNDIYTSGIIYSLNPSSKISDTSWIKPGRVAWSWCSDNSSSNKAEEQYNYIDFAAKHGWEYVCLDAGWPSFQSELAEMCKYAKSKNVGLFVWLHRSELDTYEKRVSIFKKVAEYGVVGTKCDFFDSDSAETMEMMKSCAEISAENKLMILYHGCVRPGGENRTYPNIMSFEAVQGMENYIWSDKPTAECVTYLPFIRNVVGGADFTPVVISRKTGKTTEGFQLATSVTIYSGLQHYADSVYNYERWLGTSFLDSMPAKFDEMRILGGYPGQYSIVGRRSGTDWFVGALTVEARTANIQTSFLGEGSYTAYIYSDDENGNIKLTTQTVTSSSTISCGLGTNGGCAVHIAKKALEPVKPTVYKVIEAESSANTLTGTATVSGSHVGWLGNGVANAITFNSVTVPTAGKYIISVVYKQGFAGESFSYGDSRDIYVKVNGKTTSMYLQALNSAGWDKTAEASFQASLTAGANTITLYNENSYAPDIDKIIIYK